MISCPTTVHLTAGHWDNMEWSAVPPRCIYLTAGHWDTVKWSVVPPRYIGLQGIETTWNDRLSHHGTSDCRALRHGMISCSSPWHLTARHWDKQWSAALPLTSDYGAVRHAVIICSTPWHLTAGQWDMQWSSALPRDIRLQGIETWNDQLLFPVISDREALRQAVISCSTSWHLTAGQLDMQWSSALPRDIWLRGIETCSDQLLYPVTYDCGALRHAVISCPTPWHMIAGHWDNMEWSAALPRDIWLRGIETTCSDQLPYHGKCWDNRWNYKALGTSVLLNMPC